MKQRNKMNRQDIQIGRQKRQIGEMVGNYSSYSTDNIKRSGRQMRNLDETDR